MLPPTPSSTSAGQTSSSQRAPISIDSFSERLHQRVSTASETAINKIIEEFEQSLDLPPIKVEKKVDPQHKKLEALIVSLSKSLTNAEDENNLEEIINCLISLGRAYLQMKNWNFAAKLLNASLAIFDKNGPFINLQRQSIESCIQETEKAFLETECNITHDYCSIPFSKRRDQLKTIRGSIPDLLEKEQPSQVILKKFSDSIELLMIELITSILQTLGRAPCEFTLLSLGSLARKEMSPYSDLEFAFLIQVNNEENLEYFRKMTKWLEIQVINLGETAIRILKRGTKSPIAKGFAFDEGGNTPLGKEGYVQLIKTPKELAQLQSDRFYGEDLILSNILRGAGILFGNEILYEEYLNEMNIILSRKGSSIAKTIREQRAMHLLNGHLAEFNPSLDKQKEEFPVFNIKAELYRLPTFLVAGLADFYGIEVLNTWDKIDTLTRMNILSKEGAENLKRTLSRIVDLRIRCHLHYGHECDEIYHRTIKDTNSENLFYFNETDTVLIIEIFKVILPLHRTFKEACRLNNFSILASETFFDDSLPAQAEANERICKFVEAKKLYHQALTLNPEDDETYAKLVGLLVNLQKLKEASDYIYKMFQLGQQKNNEKIIADSLFCSGLVNYAQHNNQKAVTCFTKSLELYIEKFGERDRHVAAALAHLGSASRSLPLNVSLIDFDISPLKSAHECYMNALKIDVEIYGEQHENVARDLNGIGNVIDDKAEIAEMRFHDRDSMNELSKKAIEYYERALKVNEGLFGRIHPHVAMNLNNIAVAYARIGEKKNAKNYYDEALKINIKVYGTDHITVIVGYHNLGCSLQDLNQLKEALACYNKSFSISQRLFGDEHPTTEKVYFQKSKLEHMMNSSK